MTVRVFITFPCSFVLHEADNRLIKPSFLGTVLITVHKRSSLEGDLPCWDTNPPGADTTPAAGNPPWEQIPPGADPPGIEHAGRYGQRAGGTHPTGMQSCFRMF